MLEQDGKIWVVALVMAIIFIGIAAFLFFLEYRLKRAEKKLRELEESMDQPDQNKEPQPSRH